MNRKKRMVFAIYLLVLNIVAFAIYGFDKYCAIYNRWRVSEFSLLTIAIGGGSLGALLAMCVFHHKTRHKKFQIVTPISLIVHILLLIILL